MMALLAAMLMVSCDDSTALPSVTESTETIELGQVEWRVLKVDADKKQALLISKDILEEMAFDADSNGYENSDIRTYLKSDGFFTKYGLDKSYMKEVDVLSDINKTEIKENDGDYVFLLSKEETNVGGEYYFADSNDRIAYKDGGAVDWWLRTPASNYVDYITADGYQDNQNKFSDSKGLRPAFWYTWK